LSAAIEATERPVNAWQGPALLVAGAMAIGFAPIGLRLGLDTMGPQAIAFWRYIFATPMILAVLCIVHRRRPFLPNRYVIMAGTFFALDIALWHWGLTLTTVANATFIVNLGNIMVGLVAWFVLKDRPTKFWFLAIAVALVGAPLLTLGGGEGGKTDIRGDALAFGAAILVSGYMICATLAREDLSALDVLFWLTVTEAIVSGVVTFVSGETFIPNDPAGWRAPLLLAVVVQLMGQGLIIAGLGRTPAGIAGVLVLIQPVTAAAVSWVIFDEALLAIQVLGAALIIAGVLLSQRKPRRAKLS